MTTEPSPNRRLTLSELIIRPASGDLLEVEPLDLGPGSPATAALEAERGPQPSPRPDSN